jgi:hypothetical protein
MFNNSLKLYEYNAEYAIIKKQRKFGISNLEPQSGYNVEFIQLSSMIPTEHLENKILKHCQGTKHFC